MGGGKIFGFLAPQEIGLFAEKKCINPYLLVALKPFLSTPILGLDWGKGKEKKKKPGGEREKIPPPHQTSLKKRAYRALLNFFFFRGFLSKRRGKKKPPTTWNLKKRGKGVWFKGLTILPTKGIQRGGAGLRTLFFFFSKNTKKLGKRTFSISGFWGREKKNFPFFIFYWTPPKKFRGEKKLCWERVEKNTVWLPRVFCILGKREKKEPLKTKKKEG